MDRARWERLEALFDAAADLPTDEREAYLLEACGEDAALRRQVESLLIANDSASGAFEGIVGDAARAVASGLEAGQRVGPWELVREIGHGGMGAVFLARRADGEYEAEVALKLIGGVQTAEHRRRFRAERQILSDLQHPNIARLLGGGTTEGGAPWVTMELVDGLPLDRYCAERALSIDERLRLVLDVFSAVRYAHQHLVVHRDLKPANILVTAAGVPKLLDFGIAKLIGPGAADPHETQTAIRLLTPAYASPEQLRGAPITVATDVYGLGVILYQLLAGRLPHDVAGKMLGEIERLICEEDPPRPSTVVASPADVRRLRGDLDTIVMTALQKDPRRRYESVERFADDIERHLSALPVRARPDSRAYRIGRFVQRHRAGVSVAAGAVVLLTGFAVAMGVQARRLAVERDAATLERAKAEQVAAFLTSVFGVADPSQSRGETVTARELLDAGARRIASELRDQPDVQASMMRVIGDVYGTLGMNEAARPLLEQALTQHRTLYGDDHDEVATSQLALAVLLQDVGNVADAEPLFRQSLATRRRLYGPRHPKVSESLSDLAYLLQTNGNDSAAAAMFREVLGHNRALYPAGDEHIASTMTKLARSLRPLREDAEAEQLLRDALVMQRAHFGNAHPDVASTLRNLASLLRDIGKLDEADTLFQEAIAMRRAIFGDDHPETANTLNSYGLLLQRKGEDARAIEVLTEFIRILEKIHREPHPSLAAAYSNLAVTMREMGRLDEAASLYARSMRVQDVVLSPSHPNTAFPRIGLASVYMDQRRYREAERLQREAVAVRRAALPAGHRYIGESLSDLGASLTAQRRYAEADTLLVEAYGILRAAEGEEAARTVRSRERLADLYRRWGRPERATAVLGAPPP